MLSPSAPPLPLALGIVLQALNTFPAMQTPLHTALHANTTGHALLCKPCLETLRWGMGVQPLPSAACGSVSTEGPWAPLFLLLLLPHYLPSLGRLSWEQCVVCTPHHGYPSPCALLLSLHPHQDRVGNRGDGPPQGLQRYYGATGHAQSALLHIPLPPLSPQHKVSLQSLGQGDGCWLHPAPHPQPQPYSSPCPLCTPSSTAPSPHHPQLCCHLPLHFDQY